MLIENFLSTARQRMCCIETDAALLQAARLLEREHEMLVVCGAEGRMAGVLTKSDVVRQMGVCTGASCSAPLVDAMSRNVVSAPPESQLADAWEMMKDHALKNIPVVASDGKPLGVLNARDLLRELWSEVDHEEELLLNYVMGIGYR